MSSENLWSNFCLLWLSLLLSLSLILFPYLSNISSRIFLHLKFSKALVKLFRIEFPVIKLSLKSLSYKLKRWTKLLYTLRLHFILCPCPCSTWLCRWKCRKIIVMKIIMTMMTTTTTVAAAMLMLTRLTAALNAEQWWDAVKYARIWNYMLLQYIPFVDCTHKKVEKSIFIYNYYALS